MKIICIGRNYADHAAELGNAVPDEPVIFMKPKSALLQAHTPFYYPEFTNELHYECELVLRVCKTGKYIQERHAANYYNGITVGIDFTARDLQDDCKKNGLPWEKAKAFDHSAAVSEFIPVAEFDVKNGIPFRMKLNGELRQNGSSNDMIFSFDKILSYVSKFITLRTGDYIFTGTPAGVGPVNIGDKLEGFIGERPMFSFLIK